jgi:glycerate kinase
MNVNSKNPSFLIVPDSFKDSLSAKNVGKNIAAGIKQIFNKSAVKIIPMADGGEGTVDSIVYAAGGEIIKTTVEDALGRPTESFFGIINNGKTAIIEMAAASGIEKLNLQERNPWITSTYGTGQLIKAALDKNCKEIIIGIGGSATNDAGVGMAMALGAKFTDKNGNTIKKGGGFLKNIVDIDLSQFDNRINNVKIIAATDVTAPLTGKNGASFVFAPQKGASPEMVTKLDNNLKHFANIVKAKFNIDIDNIAGSGAAGGLGAGLFFFLHAKIESGFSVIAKLTSVEDEMSNYDIIITAEGKVDSQTETGKTPVGVALLAQKFNKPVFVFTGNATEKTDELYKQGITSLIPITRKPCKLNEALLNADIWLQKSAEELCIAIKIGLDLS